MTLGQVGTQFDSEWIVLGDPKTDDGPGSAVAMCLWQSQDRDEVCRKSRRVAATTIAMLYTGRGARRHGDSRVYFVSIQGQRIENRRLTIMGTVLAVVLGLLGLPGAIEFLNAYIAPHIPWMAALDEKSLLRIGILALVSFVVIVVAPLASWLISRRIRWKSPRGRIRRL